MTMTLQDQFELAELEELEVKQSERRLNRLRNGCLLERLFLLPRDKRSKPDPIPDLWHK